MSNSNHARHIYSVRDNQEKTGTIFKIANHTIAVQGNGETTAVISEKFPMAGVSFLHRPVFTYGVQCTDLAGNTTMTQGGAHPSGVVIPSQWTTGTYVVPQVTASVVKYEKVSNYFTHAYVIISVDNSANNGLFKLDVNLVFMGIALP